jgi:hypothetical protein
MRHPLSIMMITAIAFSQCVMRSQAGWIVEDGRAGVFGLIAANGRAVFTFSLRCDVVSRLSPFRLHHVRRPARRELTWTHKEFFWLFAG